MFNVVVFNDESFSTLVTVEFVVSCMESHVLIKVTLRCVTFVTLTARIFVAIVGVVLFSSPFSPVYVRVVDLNKHRAR